MSDEPTLEDFDEEFDATEAEQALDIVQNTMETFLDSATVDAVYGDPVENGDTLVIPTAEVLAVMAFGVGGGSGTNAVVGEQANRGAGSGGGGGGRVLSRPVAVIVASPEGVRVEPVVDVTKISMAALTAFGFVAAMISGFLRPKKALRSLRNG